MNQTSTFALVTPTFLVNFLCVGMIADLQRVFKQECSTSFFEGKRRSGKTNFALLLAQDALNLGLIRMVATNIKTVEFEQIQYKDDLEEWGKKRGRKIYLLDEIGKHLNRVRFMTELSKQILDVIQLAGHFDMHIMGCCPTVDLVDKLFQDTDLLDLKVRKLNRKKAKIWNYVTHHYGYVIKRIPATRISYDSRDIAPFGLTNPNKGKSELDRLPKCCRASYLYLKLRSFRKVANEMHISHQFVPKLLDKHLKHSFK